MNIVRRQDADDSQLQGLIQDSILRQILARRGVHRPEDLDTSLKGLLHYNQLQDIYVAADEIARAIMKHEHIMIAGDYDVDGMTGTALGVKCLTAFGLPKNKISFYVPSRYVDGYGLSRNAVDFAIANKVNLIVTVDNGVAAFESIDYAVANGIRVVVTDHHEIQDRLPSAIAVVDPKRKDDNFASKNLCGVGVLFYVMTAVRAKLVEYNYFNSLSTAPNMAQFLDLVTLGTIGDVMALDSNNRRLVKTGLNQIKEKKCGLGIQALMLELELTPNRIDPQCVAFSFCPHFNAATRIKLPDNPAIVNLLTDSPEEARMSAKQLGMCNKRRTDYEKVMLADALAQMEIVYGKKGQTNAANVSGSMFGEMPPRSQIESRVSELIENDASALDEDSQDLHNFAGFVLFEPTFLTGLVGLVANRVKERYGKPCVIFGADVGTGSDGLADTFIQMQKQNVANAPRVLYGTPAQGGYAPNGQPQSYEPYQGYQANEPAQRNQYSELSDQVQPHPGLFPIHSGYIGASAGGMSYQGKTQRQEQNNVQYQGHISPQYKPELSAGSDGYVELEDVYDGISRTFADPSCKEKIVGSARSIEGIDLMEVFGYIKQRNPKILISCGGHAIAAGVTIKAKDLNTFRYLFNEACQACNKSVEGEQSVAVVTDGALPSSHLCLEFAKDLETFGPWGKEFEEPKFDGVFIFESGQLLKERHLKVKLRTEDHNVVVEGIKFRASAKEKKLLDFREPVKVRVLYTLGINYYLKEKLQLNMEALELYDEYEDNAY